MSRRVVAGLIAIMLVLILGGTVLAQVSSGSAPLHLRGQAGVQQTGRLPVLQLTADAVDGSGYHLEASLTPQSQQQRERNPRGGQTISLQADGGAQGRERERERGDDDGQRGGSGSGSSNSVPLSGQFTLSAPGISPVTGQAAGEVGQDGTGQLQLTGGGGSVQADVSFSLNSSGILQMDLNGRVPAGGSAGLAGQPSVAGISTDQGDHAFWFLTRAAGMSAYLLLFLNVVLGLSVRTRVLDAVMAKWRSFDLHQFTALVAMAFLSLHLVTLLADRYIGFSVQQMLVPFASPYRPVWTAMGVLALYLIVVVTASSYLKKFIGYRSWRALHYLTLGSYLMALAHGVMSGSDSGTPWARAIYLSTGIIVAVLAARRFRRAGSPSRARATVRQPAGGVSQP